jgi:hypothetical protein
LSIKKNILIVLSSKSYFRNYVTTRAFQTIKENFHIHYFLSSEISEFDEISSENLHFFTPDHKSDAQHLRIFNLLMWRNRKKSISFAFRIKRFHQLKLGFPHGTNFIIRFIKIFWRLVQWLLIRFEAYVIASSPFFPTYLNLFIHNLTPHPVLKSVLDKVNPDLVIYPSSTYEAIGNDVISECKRLNIKSLFLIDNWDNLSSKSVLWQKPSYISVWGDQSKAHAMEIQGMQDNQIYKLGTPRFNSYFMHRDEDLKSPYPYRYILFVGTTLPFNEAYALYMMDKVIDSNQSTFPNTKIIYRPHPWRQGTDSISKFSLRHVIVDKQLRESYFKQDFSENIQPEISYYPQLLQNAEFVTGGLTSMVIEATIFRQPFIALVHEDDSPVTTPKNIYKNFTHFREIDQMRNIIFCNSLSSIKKSFIEASEQKLTNTNETIDSDRMYFYHYNNKEYCDNLNAICYEILG